MCLVMFFIWDLNPHTRQATMLPDELFPLFSSSRGQRIYIDWNPEEEKEEPMSVHCLYTTLIDLKKTIQRKNIWNESRFLFNTSIQRFLVWMLNHYLSKHNDKSVSCCFMRYLVYISNSNTHSAVSVRFTAHYQEHMTSIHVFFVK